MIDLEKISDQLGYLVLTEDGAVQASGGELENDEKSANVIMGLISLTDSVDPAIFPKTGIKKISIIYEYHRYVICLSNKRIYIVKKRNTPNSELDTV